jgi:hypothetical protein
MSIKLETTETTTLKLLQEKVAEANNVVQAYASLLSKKYELPKDGQFTFNSDFTQIVEIPKPPAVDASDADVVPLEGRKKRKKAEVEETTAV